jgi:DNA-directed RNA polymerase beta' subunit
LEYPEFVLQYKEKDRLTKLYQEVSKRFDRPINTCYRCKKQMTHITINGSFPEMQFIHCPEGKISSTSNQQYNPNYIHSLLMNMSDQTCELLGFKSTCQPRNFMTKYMVIIPNKLRVRTIDRANSTVTATYNKLCTEVIPELNKCYQQIVSTEMFIPNNAQADIFSKMYIKLCAYIGTFLDMTTAARLNLCMRNLGKRDTQHIDVGCSLVGRLKGKESSYFEKGIVGTRHKTSARTVLGGATDLHSNEIGFPQKYCTKMGYYVPIYEENIEIMRQFVSQMKHIQKHDRTHIKAVRYLNSGNGKTPTIKANNAELIASQLMPGDKLFISLLPGSLVMHCRFPAVREESWATHELVPTQHTVQTLPLAACGYKNADFDGDETGMYVNHGWYTDAESLLLHSLYRQMLDYKKGTIGVFYSTDTPFELNRFNKDSQIGVICDRDPVSDRVVAKKNIYPVVSVIDTANHFLDIVTGHVDKSTYTNHVFSKIDKINYEDDSTKVVDNKFSPDKFKLVNQTFYIYLVTLIGPERTMALIDLFIQLGYCSANYEPFTLGREIRYYGDSKQKIQEIHNATYEKLRMIEETNFDEITKERKQYVENAEQKRQILPLLTGPAKDSNLDKQGLLKKFNNEFYKSMVNMDPIVINEHRIQNTLGGNRRTCTAFSNYSVDPCAYGYIKHGYLDNMVSPTDTFFDCMLQRRSMYDRGVGVAIGGYLSKEFIMAFGPVVTDSNGAMTFNNKFISPCYGIGGYNPRYSFKLPLPDIELSTLEIAKKYGKEVGDLHEIITEAREDYKRVTNFTTIAAVGSNFNCGFNYEQFLKNYPSGKTDQKIVDELIENLQLIFAPEKMIQRYSLLNFIYIEYYLRTKLQQIKINRNTALQIYYKFVESLVETGETVGMKASIGIAESLTQDLLDAIHHATGGGINTNKLKMAKGNSRFKELLSQAAIQPDSIVVTLGFYDGSKEAVEKFALEHETIYFSDIWVQSYIILTSGIDDEVKQIHPTIDFEEEVGQVSRYALTMIWDLTTLGDYNIPISKVCSTLVDNFESIKFVTGRILNSREFLAYIYFEDNTSIDTIDEYLTQWYNKDKKNVINGSMLVNCYVSQNLNTGEYILQANVYKNENTIRKEDKSSIVYNTMAFQEILLDPLIDVSKCKTNETKQATGKLTANNYDMFGVFEASARLCEEVTYCSNVLSNVGDILPRHYKTICLSCLANGDYFFASANSAAKSDGDYFRKIHFEQPSKFLELAIEQGEWKPVSDVIAAQYFGDLPKAGSGYSKTMIFREDK